jgi:phosphopantothenoylcysteine decarboxylase
MVAELRALDDVKSPREKLEILLGVHKILVDGLMFPPEDNSTRESQSSSADLLLPILIYRYSLFWSELIISIIQADTETLISNIQFIQRFRADTLLQGEASYCLTNLVLFLRSFD